MTPKSAKAKAIAMAKREATRKAQMGRPPKYATAEEFTRKASEYFHYCDTKLATVDVDEDGKAKMAVVPEPYSIEGLVDYCDIYRDTLWDWEQGDRGVDFSNAVKECKRKIHADWSRRLQTSKNPAGVIFYGKAALGYRDVQVVEQSGPGGKPVETKVTIEVIYPQSRRELANEQASAAITAGK